MRTVLVVEDEARIAGLVRDYLEHAGFAVLTAGDGAGGLALARARRPDAIVLDLGLPRVDGLDVIRALRRASTVPIVILTARGDETDRIAGLELGADDYVAKPFSPRELVARIRAVLRRSEMPPLTDERIRAGDLELDLARRQVRVAGRPVRLTPTEFELLATLAREPGRVWTRSQLLDAVRGFSLETYERAIDGHIRNLRRKIEPGPGAPTYVRTVHGVGYALADDDPPPVRDG
jgi:DNA-binding response OmpR family regulator